MKALFLVPGLILTFTCTAQNMVQNHDFELYVPDSINGGTGNNDVTKAVGWLNLGIGTCDYFHSDYNFVNPRVPANEYGSQAPHSGSAYAGIYCFEITSSPNIREYLATQLSSPMVAGQLYNISFYTSLAEHSNFVASYGVNFSATPNTNMNGYLMLATEHIHVPVITDAQNWTLVTGTYLASGGEQYITIGGYFDDQNSDTMTVGSIYPNAYYYIDDVSVTPAHAEGVEENQNSLFEIYPSPCSGLLYLRHDDQPEASDIRITDVLGREMQCPVSYAGNCSVIDVGVLPDGMYIVSVAGASSRFLKIAE